jgi:hypothetical protein
VIELISVALEAQLGDVRPGPDEALRDRILSGTSKCGFPAGVSPQPKSPRHTTSPYAGSTSFSRTSRLNARHAAALLRALLVLTRLEVAR